MAEDSKRRRSGNRSKLRFSDVFRVGSSGLRTRKLRSALSTIGITIGIGVLVSVLGLSESGSADLIEELDALGTNLLTIEAGQGFGSGEVKLPVSAPAMVKRIPPIYEVSTVSGISGAVLRNDLVNDGRTRGITIFAADLNLIKAQRGTMRSGEYFSSATAEFPTVVLGSVAAERLGLTNVTTHHKLWIENQWFAVIGILNPLPLAADLDRSAIVGYGAARRFLDHDETPDVVYVRAYPEHLTDVRSVLAGTVNPENPEEVQVSRASDVLEARAAAQSTFTNLFVGLGAVSLLVGGIGIANVMVITVIERRNEIGLRRALGATRLHIAFQFLSEALLLSVIGGIGGIVLGILVTFIYATWREWTIVIPAYVLLGGLLSSVLIGCVAGLYPALRASSMSPTDALRTN